MQLLDLPIEIFHEILFFASLSRGLVRALRLRLVCRPFHHALNLTLLRTHLLDQFLDEHFHWPIVQIFHHDRHVHAKRLWHDFISSRVRKESNPKVKEFAQMRKVVEELRIRVGGDFESILDALSWVALGYNPFYFYGENSSCDERSRADDFLPCLLSAAAHLDHITLAKQLIEEGCCPFTRSALFPAPISLAALAGNSEMVKLFQKHLLECRYPDGYIQGIHGAFQRGDVNILRQLASVDGLLKDAMVNLVPGLCTSLDVLHFARARWNPNFSDYDTFMVNVEYNNVAVVRHILDQDMDNSHLTNGEIPLCLEFAAGWGYEQMVNLFLDYGADPNGSEKFGTCPLIHAVKGGSLIIVRTLLDRGADLSSCPSITQCAKYALLRENTAMLEFLQGKRRCSTYLKTKLKQVALKNGLESMAEVVEQFECDEDNFRADEEGWID